jgi:hypothetical protein
MREIQHIEPMEQIRSVRRRALLFQRFVVSSRFCAASSLSLVA